MTTPSHPERAPAFAVDTAPTAPPSRSYPDVDSALTPPPRTPVEADAPAEATPMWKLLADYAAAAMDYQRVFSDATASVETIARAHDAMLLFRDRVERALTAEHTARLAAEQERDALREKYRAACKAIALKHNNPDCACMFCEDSP